MPAKTLVIGLDGATLDVIEPLVREHRLPTLSKIMKVGSYGKLRSTYPPSSAVAWPSFATGMNPGKHSIFFFNIKHSGTYYLEPVTSNNIKSVTLWEQLSRADKRVAVLNVPMTYPPRKVNGLMITGLGTPPSASEYTYPKDLAQEIERTFGERLPEVQWTQYDDENIPKFIEDVTHHTDRIYNMAQMVLEQELWDLFMVVFTGPDRIQHRLWDYMDYNSRQYSKKLQLDLEFKYRSELVKNYFFSLDIIVHKLIEDAGNAPNIILLSDHGAGKYSRLVDLNNLLSDWGYLTYREPLEVPAKRSKVKSLAKKMGLSLSFIKRIAKLSGLQFDYYKHLEKKSKITNRIDWDRTRAFCYIGCSIYINVKGRERLGIVNPGAEYEDIVEQLRSKLLALKDPLTGHHIITEIKRKEDVYSGPYLEDAPDLVITECNPYYDFANLLFSNDVNGSIFVDLDDKVQGTHQFDGFYAISGSKIKQNFRFDNSHITDLFPTILHLMDVPIPEDVDGKVLVDIFKTRQQEIKFSSKSSQTDSLPVDITEEDKEKIIEELKGLGYM